VSTSFFRAYQFAVRFIVPLCILLIFLHQFGLV
jgi:NSS family neurotransmitter:Na+ symporter